MTRSNSAYPSDPARDPFRNMTTKKPAKDVKKDAAPPVQVGEHGRYLIKSGLLAGEYIARAFPKPPTTSRGLIAEATGETEEAAIAALHEAIDARENQRSEDRRQDSHTGAAVPSTDEFIEAIGQISLTVPQRAMLAALTVAGAEGLTEARLTWAGGYKSWAGAERSFAKAGHAIAAYLSSGVASAGATKAPGGVSLLAFRDAAQDDGTPGNWILHPELRAATQVVL